MINNGYFCAITVGKFYCYLLGYLVIWRLGTAVRMKRIRFNNLNRLLDFVCSRIETKHGRAKVVNVQTKEYFTNNVEAIKALVEFGTHFFETETLNFKTIPDPFAAFRDTIR